MKKLITVLCSVSLIALSCESQKTNHNSSSAEKTAVAKVPYKIADR